MAVLNMTEAAAVATMQVQAKFEAGVLLRTPLAAWLAGIASAMNTPAGAGDPNSIAQRTVYNQIPIGREILESLPTVLANQNQQASNIVGIYVYRTCKAVVSATAGNRISPAQNTAILGFFNALAIWG